MTALVDFTQDQFSFTQITMTTILTIKLTFIFKFQHQTDILCQ